MQIMVRNGEKIDLIFKNSETKNKMVTKQDLSYIMAITLNKFFFPVVCINVVDYIYATTTY